MGALHNGEANVDGVAVEDAGKGGGDDALHTAGLDGQRGVLTAGAAAKVRTSHDDVAGLDGGSEVLIDVLHAVGGQGRGRGVVQVPGGDDDVSVHVGTVFVNLHWFVDPFFTN